MNSHRSGFPRVLVFLAVFFLFAPVLGARAAAADPRQPLDTAILSLWLEGPSEQVLAALQGLATGTHDAAWGKALFHLACGYLLKGDRAEAEKRLQELQKEAGNPQIAGFVTPLNRLLVPQPVTEEKVSLDFKDAPIEQVIRMVAKASGRAVIIDSEIQPKRVSILLPNADFDQVMKILADLGEFQTKMVGDILLVTPKEKPLDSQVASAGNISLDLKNVDVKDAMRLIARKSGINLVFHKDVRGPLTINLKDIAPLEALRLITRSSDLFMEKDGDSYLVMNLAAKERLTGKSDSLTVPLKNLDPRDALLLLRDLNLPVVQPAKEGSALFMKGGSELLEKARAILIAQDTPQSPVMITASIWEVIKAGAMKAEDFPKLTPEQKKEFARLLSSPRIITIPGRPATIEIDSAGKSAEKDAVNLKLDILPFVVGEGLIRLEMKIKVRTYSETSDQQKKENVREFSSTFVVRMDTPFAYEFQGGSVPTLIELMVTKAQQ